MSAPPRIDAHQHYWRIAARVGHWPPPELATIHRDFSPADLEPLLAQSRVDGTVLVQTLPREEDTAWMLALADRHDSVWGVVGWTDMKAADAADRIAALASHPKFRGLRPMLQDLPDDDWIADGAVDAAALALQRHGLVFDALVLTRHLRALERFVLRHPGLAVVIDHGAKPEIATGAFDAWHQGMARLAASPNTSCKLSGLLTEAGDRTTISDLRPYVQALWKLFGPGRLLWGSDWPVVELAAGYPDWLRMSRDLVDGMEPPARASDREAVFGGNALRIYRLRPPPTAA